MIQKTGSIHVYFQRNKGHLAGVIFHSGGNGGNDVGICVSENWRIAGRYDKGSDFETGRDSFVYCFLLCSQSECLRLLSEDISEADQYTAEEGCVRCSAGSGYDPVYEQQQWDVSLNTE